MSEKDHWTLQKIREAYSEILRSYNVFFPIQLGGKKKNEVALDAFDCEGDNFYLDVFPKKARKALRKLKKDADRSGNVQVWNKGETLNSLNQDMKERIEKALKFGI